MSLFLSTTQVRLSIIAVPLSPVMSPKRTPVVTIQRETMLKQVAAAVEAARDETSGLTLSRTSQSTKRNVSESS